MSSSPFVWRVLRTATDSSAATNLRCVATSLFLCAVADDGVQLFPGLIYRMIKPKVVLLVFACGKLVLTGAKVIVVFIPSDIHYPACVPRPHVDACRADVFFLPFVQVREEIYTAFNTIYTVLCEFRGPRTMVQCVAQCRLDTKHTSI